MDIELDDIITIEESIIYQEELDAAIAEQKQMVSQGKAVILPVIKLGGCAKKGAALTSKIGKLILRAYDYETKDLIRDVKYNKKETVALKISKLAATISGILNPQFDVRISQDYVTLKLKQLDAYHKHAVAKQSEKEAARAFQEELREQAKAEKEREEAVKLAEKEAKAAEEAMAKATAKFSGTIDEQDATIIALRARLEEATANKERALSQAQMTRAGYVYVLKNTGTFGEDHYKIGMTRRLVPEDRVKELSSAAVPFPFAVCAMFEADDAPTLEKELHNCLDEFRVNKANRRKEHFAVSLDTIVEEVHKRDATVVFNMTPEELEYDASC